MKKPHRFSEPYPENSRRPRVKTTDRTKIELELKDAHKLADIVQYLLSQVGQGWLIPSERQLINLLIKKLRTTDPELEF